MQWSPCNGALEIVRLCRLLLLLLLMQRGKSTTQEA